MKFGFEDPFVLGVLPRLISPHGGTVLNMTGYGFVESADETDSIVRFYSTDESELSCPS